MERELQGYETDFGNRFQSQPLVAYGYLDWDPIYSVNPKHSDPAYSLQLAIGVFHSRVFTTSKSSLVKQNGKPSG
jgi:hypothetical protein